MPNITAIKAEPILDSRKTPTLRVTVYTENSQGTFDVPSGSSTGSHEAVELRDPGAKTVTNAIELINTEIAQALTGMDIHDQAGIDARMRELDGTPQKSRLGGNSLIGVSIAVAKAAAVSDGVELYAYLRTLRTITPSQSVPRLFMNVVNGGKHAKTKLAFQEYHVVPDTDDVAAAIQIGKEFMDDLEAIAKERYLEGYSVGDEGGLALPLTDVHEPLQIMRDIIEKRGWKNVRLGLDVAASSFWNGSSYDCSGKQLSPDELLETYKNLSHNFSLLNIEDPFHEEAFDDFAKLQALNGPIVVGDDLTVTNAEFLKKAIEQKSVRALIIKPNQIGTLTETLDTMELARKNDIHCIVSHRSGDTMDSFIADLAYAFGTWGLKSGVPRQPERIIKLERLQIISTKNNE